MKKIFKLFIVLFVGFIFLTNANAQVIYNNLTVTIDGVNLESSSPLDNAKVVYNTGSSDSLNDNFAVFAPSQSLLTDSMSSSDYSNLSHFSFRQDEPYIPVSSYSNVAEKSNDVYTAIYSYDSSSSSYKRISSIASIERPNIPLTKRFNIYVLDNISFHLTGINDISVPKTINYKIGKINDNALLRRIKNGTGINDLLTYAKNDTQAIKTGSVVQQDLTIRAINDMSQSSFVDRNYYYVYSSRDTANGTYLEYEDVNVYQYINSGLDTYPFLASVDDSRFVWEVDETVPASTINFEFNSYACEKTTNINTHVISSSTVESYTSSNDQIAAIAVNPAGNSCPTGATDCYEVTISCLTIGNVTIKAKNADNKEASVTTEVLESLDPVMITYNSTEGSACTAKNLYKGQKAGTLCRPTKKGYTFDGWYTSETEGERVTSETVINQDITLFARWAKEVVNPKTGFTTPVYVFIGIIVVSLAGLGILEKRTKMF